MIALVNRYPLAVIGALVSVVIAGSLVLLARDA